MVDWKRGRRSKNIEDRRGMAPKGGVALGGGGLVILIILSLFFGIDPSELLESGALQQPPQTQSRAPANDETTDYLSVMLATTEDTWHTIFNDAGMRYREPKLVLFSGAVDSACGRASSAVGPFYCPPDEKLFLDTSFFRDMETKLGAKGDFAQAYVVAHEVGHHVQTILGTSAKVRQAKRGLSKTEANKLTVRMELQADCYAGLWAHHDEAWQAVTFDAQDIREAMGAAAAVGDDRLQMRGQGYVVPESFTHGTSEQRMRWFDIGLRKGTLKACDTFSTARL